MVELAVLKAAASPTESSIALCEAAEFYKVDVGAITAKVKQEFATKDKAKAAKTGASKPTTAQRIRTTKAKGGWIGVGAIDLEGSR